MKPILFALLTTVTLPAQAEWTPFQKVGRSAVFYIEKSTMARRADVATIRTLRDNFRYLHYMDAVSIVKKTAFNCTNATMAMESSVSYDGRMGQGAIIRSEFIESVGAYKWMTVMPNTFDDALMQMACTSKTD